MKLKRTKLIQILLKGLSAFFVIWLSGVLVLVCCGSRLFTASAMISETEKCPLKEHDCCKKNKDTNSIAELQEDSADCCIFKPLKTLSADLQNSKNIKQPQIATAKIDAPKPTFFIKQTYNSPQIYHSVIRNRGSTYLFNCNLRI